MNQRHDQHIAFSEWVCSASTRSVWSALSPRRFALCEN